MESDACALLPGTPRPGARTRLWRTQSVVCRSVRRHRESVAPLDLTHSSKALAGDSLRRLEAITIAMASHVIEAGVRKRLPARDPRERRAPCGRRGFPGSDPHPRPPARSRGGAIRPDLTTAHDSRRSSSTARPARAARHHTTRHHLNRGRRHRDVPVISDRCRALRGDTVRERRALELRDGIEEYMRRGRPAYLRCPHPAARNLGSIPKGAPANAPYAVAAFAMPTMGSTLAREERRGRRTPRRSSSSGSRLARAIGCCAYLSARRRADPPCAPRPQLVAGRELTYLVRVRRTRARAGADFTPGRVDRASTRAR